jgi:hypothetical protein
MDGVLTTLLSSGIDAFSNLWDVKMTFPSGITTLLNQNNASTGVYSVRATGFTPPELGVTTYTVDYKTVQLTRPNAKFEGERTFTLEFRLDSGYQLYYDLLSWKHIFFDPSGESNMEFGSLSRSNITADQKNYGIISVQGYDSSTDLSNISSADVGTANIQIHWDFYDVVCMKVGTPAYQRQNSDALTTTATFIFGRLYEPGSSVSNGQNTTPTLNFSAT